MVHAFSLNQFLAQIYMKHKWASEGTRRGEEKGGGGPYETAGLFPPS